MTFLSSYETIRNEGTCVATLDVKEGGVGVSDSNVITDVKCSNLSVDVTPYQLVME